MSGAVVKADETGAVGDQPAALPRADRKRTLSPADLAAMTGYNKKSVNNWVNDGHAGQRLPADRLGLEGKRPRWLLNFEEFSEWCEAVGIDQKKGGERPLIDAAENIASARDEDEQRAVILKAEIVEQIGRGDVVASMRMSLLNMMELIEGYKQSGKQNASAFQAITAAQKHVSSELRMIAEIEDERAAKLARVMPRDHAGQILAACMDLVRQQMAALGVDVGVKARAIAIDLGIDGLEGNQGDRLSRALADAAQMLCDERMEMVAESVRRAAIALAPVLAEESRARGSREVVSGPVVGGLFDGKAA